MGTVKELLFSDEIIDAKNAKQIGLAQEVNEPTELAQPALAALFNTKDQKEEICAFAEKRTAEFRKV